MSIEIAKEAIASHNWESKDWFGGCVANFKYITPSLGVKWYCNHRMADKTYAMQKLAFQHGLAPEPLQKFKIEHRIYGTLKAYLTETVDWIPGEYITQIRKIAGIIHSADMYYKYGLRYLKTEEYIILEQKLWKLFVVDDLHGNNVGYMADGRLVCIDFSHFEVR